MLSTAEAAEGLTGQGKRITVLASRDVTGHGTAPDLVPHEYDCNPA